MKAGFDISVITLSDWENLLNHFEFDTTPTKHSAASGWHWWKIGSTNDLESDCIVTAVNPFNGEHYSGNEFLNSTEPGFVSYVGIEGSPEFVANFFVAFKEVAEFIKDEEFGRRSFI